MGRPNLNIILVPHGLQNSDDGSIEVAVLTTAPGPHIHSPARLKFLTDIENANSGEQLVQANLEYAQHEKGQVRHPTTVYSLISSFYFIFSNCMPLYTNCNRRHSPLTERRRCWTTLTCLPAPRYTADMAPWEKQRNHFTHYSTICPRT